jgi:hypothetical protein
VLKSFIAFHAFRFTYMPTRLIVETDPPDSPVTFSGPTYDLAHFISFAYATRFGADHELAAAATRLQRQHKIELRALITFADSEPDDALEREELAKAWQDAARLADSAKKAADAFASDEKIQALIAEYPNLPSLMQELAQIASWAAEQGGKVRLTFKME